MTIEMTCENCGEKFYCYPSDKETGRKYCSLQCRSSHRFGKALPAPSRVPVGFTCKECSKPFTMMQGYLTAYRKKFDREPMYCSNDCSYAGRKKDADARAKFICVQCGKESSNRRKPGGRIYEQQKLCSQACKIQHQKQRAFDKFNAKQIGRHVKRHGYIWISIPALASPTGKKMEMLEHRWVMSQHIGRLLRPTETVHHKDGDRSHNLIGNLELFDDRHGPGQRVVDKVQFAIEMLTSYPDFARAQGYALIPVDPVPVGASVDGGVAGHQISVPDPRSEPC